MVLTTLAVASVSVWLVFPYLALMALILITPAGRGKRELGATAKSEAGSVDGEELADSQAEAGFAGECADRGRGEPVAGAELVVEPAEAVASDSETRAVKTRRGKGRMRKSKAVAESPSATATWIRIGPGKFVRVENPDPSVAATSPFPVSQEATPETPAADDPIAMDAGGDPEQSTGPEHDAESAPAGVVTPESHPHADAPPPADIGAEYGAGTGESVAEITQDAGEQAFAEFGEPVIAEEAFAPSPGMDADSENAPGVFADAAGDNGIAPDAFAYTTEDNGIAPDAFVDIPPPGVEPEDDSSPDEGARPSAAADSFRPSPRATLGKLMESCRGCLPYSGRARQGRSVRGRVSSGRFVRSGRKARISPGLRRPSRRVTVRSRQSCRPFPPRSPPRRACGSIFEPVKSTGMVSGVPFGKTEGTPGPSPCSFAVFGFLTA